jgi:hypothetical protein
MKLVLQGCYACVVGPQRGPSVTAHQVQLDELAVGNLVECVQGHPPAAGGDSLGNVAAIGLHVGQVLEHQADVLMAGFALHTGPHAEVGSVLQVKIGQEVAAVGADNLLKQGYERLSSGDLALRAIRMGMLVLECLDRLDRFV